jgi:hypothetical protein
MFGHLGDEISENKENKYTGLQGGMKLSLAPNLVTKKNYHPHKTKTFMRPI